MRWMRSGLVCIAMALAVPVAAQQGPGRDRPQMQRGPGIERLLQLERTLELSESQIEQLNALQAEIEAMQDAHQAEARDFRLRVRAGDVTRNEIREWTEARRTLQEGMRESHRERIGAILSVEQRARLGEIDQLGRERGRAMGSRGMRGPRDRAGVRGGRGFQRDRPMRGGNRSFRRGRRGGGG